MSAQQRKSHLKKFIDFTAAFPAISVEDTKIDLEPSTPGFNNPLPNLDVAISETVVDGIVTKAKELHSNNLIGVVPGNQSQVVITSKKEDYPRIISKNERKSKKSHMVEIRCGPSRGCLG